MSGNVTFTIIVPQIEPMIYVENNKIKSSVPEINDLISLMPNVNQILIPVKNYILGTANDTGYYSGLLGYLQRLEGDLVFYPVPMDIYEPPGIFGVTLIESGTRILTVTKFTHKKNSDISNSFFNFDSKLVVLFFLTFIFLALFVGKLSKFSMCFVETLYLLYQFLLKKQVINKFGLKEPFFITFLLFYHNVLSILIEANVNTSLIVYETPKSINTLNDLYEDETKLPYFVKEHFSNDHFTNKFKNKIADTICKRAKKCNKCIISYDEILSTVINNEKSKTDFAVICDAQVLFIMKNSLCFNRHNYINSIGSSHLSDKIYKVSNAILMRKNIDKLRNNIYNQKFYSKIELGLVTKLFEKFSYSQFGMPKVSDKKVKTCLNSNNIELVNNVFSSILFINIRTFFIAFSLGMFVISFVFFFKTFILKF